MNYAVKGLLNKLKVKTEVQNLYKEIVKIVYENEIKDNKLDEGKAKTELTTLRTKSEKLNDLFLDRNIQLEDYNAMKAKLRSNITELEGVLSTKTFKEDDFQKHLNKGLGVLKNLDNIYTNNDLNGKHNLLGSTFVEKLIFDGKNCRTEKSMELFL